MQLHICFEHIFLPIFHKMYKSRMIDQYLKSDVSHSNPSNMSSKGGIFYDLTANTYLSAVSALYPALLCSSRKRRCFPGNLRPGTAGIHP